MSSLVLPMHYLVQIVQRVEESLELVRRYQRRLGKDTPDATGGFFSLYTQGPPPKGSTADFELDLQIAARVGRIESPARGRRMVVNSFEKATRLGEHPLHVSSWQSRDVKHEPKKYGGAIRVVIPHYGETVAIASFSGLTEHGDETIVLSAGCLMDWQGSWGEIIHWSDNTIARGILGI